MSFLSASSLVAYYTDAAIACTLRFSSPSSTSAPSSSFLLADFPGGDGASNWFAAPPTGPLV